MSANNVQARFGVDHPCWLTASGSSERIEVLRSPLVRETDSMYQPVRRFIEDHELVLAASATVEDDGWMHGQFASSVYVPAVWSAGCAEAVVFA